MTTVPTDDAPSAARANQRLYSALWAYLGLVAVYAALAISRAAYGERVPHQLHMAALLVLTVAAVAWLAALVIIRLDQHGDARTERVVDTVVGVDDRVLVLERRLDALLSSPAVSAALHPAGTALPAEAEEVYAAGYVDGVRGRPRLRLVAAINGADVNR